MAMISRNTVRFNCPILSVPTKDNVLVSIDVGVNFHIGRSEQTFEEDARKFFYNFGPNRLEELLSQEVDEGIRDFVFNTRVHRIRDAKSEIVASLT
jgi:regulator of protease activity HflC (stomatin/prohibitin superfamily)